MYNLIDRGFKWLLFLSALAVFIIHMINSNSIGNFLSLFQYYTIQSNALVLILFSLLLLADYNIIKKRTYLPQLAAIVTSLILITGVLFHLFLAELFQPQGLSMIANFLEHTIVPFGTAIYFVFVYRDYASRSKDIPLFLIYPGLYAGVSLVRGHFTGLYPYWFLNPVLPYPNGLGSYANLTLFIFAVMVVFMVFSFVLMKAYDFCTKRMK